MCALKMALAAIRRFFRQWRVMAALMAVYGLLLAALFLFVSTKEATAWQIIVTLSSAALAPALFFILQAMIVGYALGERKASVLLKRSLEDSCKLALSSVPLALLSLLLFYLLNRLQSYYRIEAPAVSAALLQQVVTRRGSIADLTPPLQWPYVALSTLRLLIFGIVMPLLMVQLWSATLREGLASALKGMRHTLSRGFAPSALRIYTAGLILFGLIPYLLLFIRTPASRPSVEFGLFTARLLLVFVFTLLGWVLTIAALAGKGGKTKAVDAGMDAVD